MTAADAMPGDGDPLLSIVVTIVDGGDVLVRFLDAVTSQEDPPPLEIIVPFDASVSTTKRLESRYPDVLFMDLGEITPERPIDSAAGQHELYDRRRARGLGAARGDLIAILEDRGLPRADWAKTVARHHRELPHGCIGGAIECADVGLLQWAFYVCDFGRYGLPFESGPVGWVSDVNVTYKRATLEATRSLWEERFREPIVHWAMIEAGETLWLSSELVVIHERPETSLLRLLPERFDWGRLFGHIRAMHMRGWQRAAYTLLSPLIPIRLVFRHGRTQGARGRMGRYLMALPMTVVMLCARTAGEVWGYVTKRA